MSRVATLDIGTNTILLLVAEPGPRVLLERARVVRLGEGVDRSKQLLPAAIERALDTLREYAAEARRLGVTRTAAVGTQALREVGNADAFLRPARELLGCDVEVISGEREADLSWRAVAESFPELDRAAVMDIGGGSTELVVARSGRVERKVSMAIGAVRLTERLIQTDPPTDAEMLAVERAIDQALDQIGDLPSGLPLIGIAGTVTTLAALHARIDPYDGQRVHGMTLHRADLAAQVARLRGLPLAERRQLPGLDPARADVILAGALIALRTMDRLAAPDLRVSDRGVRWGLLYELLKRLPG
jgi:exopolyphosphatase/guanosine-5'-triphosphate,3'-diphosphate pyrophosphatase